MSDSTDGSDNESLGGLKLKKLSLEQVRRIDEILASIGDYGEVHLVIQHGELRYINRVQSYKAWNTGEGTEDGSKGSG
jgi:hypothetical protein